MTCQVVCVAAGVLLLVKIACALVQATAGISKSVVKLATFTRSGICRLSAQPLNRQQRAFLPPEYAFFRKSMGSFGRGRSRPKVPVAERAWPELLLVNRSDSLTAHKAFLGTVKSAFYSDNGDAGSFAGGGSHNCSIIVRLAV